MFSYVLENEAFFKKIPPTNILLNDVSSFEGKIIITTFVIIQFIKKNLCPIIKTNL